MLRRTASRSRLDVVAGDAGVAAGRLDQRAEHRDRRRLAGAVGAEEAEDLARRDLEVDAAHRLDLAVALVRPRTTTIDGARRRRRQRDAAAAVAGRSRVLALVAVGEDPVDRASCLGQHLLGLRELLLGRGLRELRCRPSPTWRIRPNSSCTSLETPSARVSHGAGASCGRAASCSRPASVIANCLRPSCSSERIRPSSSSCASAG